MRMLSAKDAAAELHNNLGMNTSSASILINNYKYLIKGEPYGRTMSSSATEYFLNNIFKENGSSQLKKSLDAVFGHINYYEPKRHVILHDIREIHRKYSSLIKDNEEYLYPEERIDKYLEGKHKNVIVNIFERNKKARLKCIEHYGYQCSACGLVLSKVYGILGIDFIHVHHIKELSSITKEYKVDPINDLRPLCPNCHAMIHRKVPAYTIDELKKIIKDYSEIMF